MRKLLPLFVIQPENVTPSIWVTIKEGGMWYYLCIVRLHTTVTVLKNQASYPKTYAFKQRLCLSTTPYCSCFTEHILIAIFWFYFRRVWTIQLENNNTFEMLHVVCLCLSVHIGHTHCTLNKRSWRLSCHP